MTARDFQSTRPMLPARSRCSEAGVTARLDNVPIALDLSNRRDNSATEFPAPETARVTTQEMPAKHLDHSGPPGFLAEESHRSRRSLQANLSSGRANRALFNSYAHRDELIPGTDFGCPLRLSVKR